MEENSTKKGENIMFQLCNLRKKKGLTQIETARLLGVGQSSVSMWEKGESTPRADLLPKIADVLGCTIDELFGRTIPQESNSTESYS